ncbi:MAG: hypothetical protein ACE5FD_13145 [Anaerolineae bacterium]
MPTPTLAPTLTATAVPPTSTPLPPLTNTAVPPSPTATIRPPAALNAELKAIVEASLPALSEDGLDGFGGVTVFPVSENPPLWAVHTYGFRSFDPLQNHFVAIYSRAGNQWQELSRLELENPDFMFEESGRQVALGDGRIWIEIQSGAGAHGSCYDLLRYDGVTLTDEISNCHSSFASQGVQDLDQDGNPDLILNFTDDYVFCYACGVRYPFYQVLTWDGDNWQEKGFNTLPTDHPAAAQHNRAVELARAGLWQEASLELALSSYRDELTVWNETLISLYVDVLRDQAENGAFPLLGHLFYGDYGSALNVLRPYSPADLFNPNSPLLAGTVAEGWNDNLAGYVDTVTSSALTVEPDLAGAYFLRGWAHYLVDPADPTILPDLQKAAELDPADPLFSDALTFLNAG